MQEPLSPPPWDADVSYVRSESLGLSGCIQQPLTVDENCMVLRYPLDL